MELHTPTQADRQSRFVRTSLTVAIIVVMNLLFNYAVSFVYNEPQYDQFVTSSQVVGDITTEQQCVAVGGQWTVNIVPPDPTVARSKSSPVTTGYCDPNYTNQKKYDAAMTIYDRNVFITLVVLGILSIIIGSLITISIIPAAFSWGGVLSLVIASIRYWSSADKLFKVIILACALGILIWLAVKKFGNK